MKKEDLIERLERCLSGASSNFNFEGSIAKLELVLKDRSQLESKAETHLNSVEIERLVSLFFVDDNLRWVGNPMISSEFLSMLITK